MLAFWKILAISLNCMGQGWYMNHHRYINLTAMVRLKMNTQLKVLFHHYKPGPKSRSIYLTGGEIHYLIDVFLLLDQNQSVNRKNIVGCSKITGASLRSFLLSTESWLDLAPEFWRPLSTETLPPLDRITIHRWWQNHSLLKKISEELIFARQFSFWNFLNQSAAVTDDTLYWYP